MKQLMLGNKALARGLYEAGCSVAVSYTHLDVYKRQLINRHTIRRINYDEY